MTCPNCRSVFDFATALEKRPEPKDRSWFICVECGSVSRFIEVAGKLILRVATVDEFIDSPGDREITVLARRTVLARLAAANDKILKHARSRLRPKGPTR